MINKTLKELKKNYDFEFTRDTYSYILEMKKKTHHTRYSVLVELIVFSNYNDDEEEIIKSLNSLKSKDVIEMYEDLILRDDYKELNPDEWEDEDGNWIDNKKVLITFTDGVVEQYIPLYRMDEVDNHIAWKNILINEDKEALGYFAQGWIDSVTDEHGDIVKIEFVKGD